MAKSIFYCYQPGTERNRNTTNLFASLWRRLAHEYVDQNYIDEYNSLKHGFRVRSGGFTLATGIEHEYGIPPPEEEMQLVGGSIYGTSFFRMETIGNSKESRSLRAREVSLNWKIEKVIFLAQLVYMSINNVVSALKIANGANAGTCRFLRPEEDIDFDKPWQYSPGITSCSIDFVIEEREIIAVTKKELLDKLKKNTKS